MRDSVPSGSYSSVCNGSVYGEDIYIPVYGEDICIPAVFPPGSISNRVPNEY